MTRHPPDTARTVYWHRELPPPGAEPLGEHVVEAVSGRVPITLAHRDDLWDRCYSELMASARERLEQEIAHLGGDCVHVLREAIATRRDDAKRQMWLHGRFTYVLYRMPQAA